MTNTNRPYGHLPLKASATLHDESDRVWARYTRVVWGGLAVLLLCIAVLVAGMVVDYVTNYRDVIAVDADSTQVYTWDCLRSMGYVGRDDGAERLYVSRVNLAACSPTDSSVRLG